MAKKLIFITSFDYPSRYAHAIHGLAMARAFAGILHDDFLFYINTAVDPSELAGMRYRRLFAAIGRRVKKLRLRRALLPLSLAAFFITHPRWWGNTVLINDPAMLPTLARLKRIFGLHLVYEGHATLPPVLESLAAHAADKIIFTTAQMREDFLTRHRGRTSDVIVLPNAVDVAAFDAVQDDKRALRTALGLPQESTLVGYIGRFEPLGSDKGLSIMLDALHDLPATTKLLLVGGTTQEIATYTAYARERGVEGRVIFVAHVDSALVPHYTKACDILAYVPAERSAFFEKETSPMKLFEYMAAKQPIIVSNLPTIRTLLDDTSAIFVEPGDVAAFAAAVMKVQSNSPAAHVAAAYDRVARNTWDARADSLLHFVATASAIG